MSDPRPTVEEVFEAYRDVLIKRREAIESEPASALAQLHLVDELAQGAPVTKERASVLLGLPLEGAENLLSAMGAGGGQLNDDGDLIGMALTLTPTPHNFRVNDNDMYAWCSYDTILLPGILETVGEVQSTDPLTGETIRLTVSAEGVADVDPPEAVTSIFVPGRTSTATDDGELRGGIDSEVCTSMLFYESRESAEKALEQYPNIAILTVEQAFDLARQTSTEFFRDLRRQVEKD